VNAPKSIFQNSVVFDEYADMSPRVWLDVVRPALSDRRGWAVFIGTPKGRNAFYELLEGNEGRPAAEQIL